jgi:hypothetical protein
MSDQDPGTFKDLFTPLGAALAFFGGLGGLHSLDVLYMFRPCGPDAPPSSAARLPRAT